MILSRTASVPYSPTQMFDLVNDIEQYPHFIPWCIGSQVLSSTPDCVEASLSFSKGLWRQSFTTRNILIPQQQVEITLLDGPFHHLTGTWSFEPIASIGCRVILALDFEFNNAFLGLTMGPVIQQLAGTVVQSFSDRAKLVYGK